jgi:hypothetical protein
MLRLLYKTLLISVLSGSLSIMNMTAFAQTSTMTAATPDGYTRDENGVLKKTETVNFKKIDSPDMLAAIVMLATGTIGARLAIAYRPITTDVMLAAAGGIAFMAGEVLSNLKYKKTMEDMSAEVTKSADGKSDQAQIERLQDLKKSYEEAKKTTGTKKTLQLAAAAAFAGAAAVSVYLSFQEDAMDAACNGAIKTAQTGLKGCISSGASGVGASEAAACGECSGELGAYRASYNLNDKATATPAPTIIKESKSKALEGYLSKMPCLASPGTTAKLIAKGVASACSPAMSFKIKEQVATSNPKSLIGSESKLLNQILFGGQRAVTTNYELYQSKESDSLFYKSLNLLFPNAEASWLPLLGLGAGAAASYFLITGSLATAIDTQMYVPMNRAIAFGVLAGLSFLASKASQNELDKIQEYIDKIDKILNEMNALAAGVKASNVNEQQLKLQTIQNPTTPAISVSSNPAIKTDCSASAGTTNCKTLTDQIKNLPDFVNLPDSFKTIATQAAAVGDGLSGTNSVTGSTLSNASNLAGKQNAIAKLLTRTKAKLNDQLASMGKPKVDFDKEQKNFLNGLSSQAAKSLQSRGTSAGDFLSSIGGSPISGSANLPTDAEAPTKKRVAAIGGGAGSASGPLSKDKVFDLDYKEAGAGESSGAGVPVKEEKYDIGTNDINTDSGESIFQVISNRYIKSGYPKLLDEIPVKK